jgi:hypothetical protein
LATYVVLAAGSVDVDATMTKFEGDLVKFCAERELEGSQIGDAVHSVFDSHVGQHIAMPALVSLTLTKLGAQPANWALMTERVQEFVRSDSSLYIGRGKGGGVSRRADLSKEELEKIAAQEAKAAAKAAK